ncbi:hypothetical protein NGRA_1995 [Nosema granulosis]|uniref:Uncharacterized protein n=1 Tax=Nosema granulosis TaxID=83296 RepID=A0A9P6H063_9MICR|nr:hypothetical protein NGRA_1995 [Nosema granulosis]
MKIKVCKEVKYKPSRVTSMCTIRDILVVFRENKTIEMVHNTTFESFLYQESEDAVIQSIFINEEECLMLLKDGSLRILNIYTLCTTNPKLEYFVKCFEVENERIYCSTKNGLIVEVVLKAPFDSKIVYKCGRLILSMLKRGAILLGDEKGRITFLSSADGENEMEVSKGPINSIIHIEEDKYVALTGFGEMVYFDSKLCTILQKVKIRDSALYCGLVVDGSIHLSGADSRMICYKKTKGVFQKSYQIDKHFLEVRSMVKIRETIFTGGADGIVGVYIPEEHKYIGLRFFDRTPTGGFHSFEYNNNFVLINNMNFAEIYKLEDTLRNKNTLETAFNTTIKLDRKFFEDLAIKNIKATNQCRLYFESHVYYIDTDGEIMVYSDKQSTKLVEITPRIHQDTYFRFPPSKYISVNPENIILQSIDLKIRIIDRKDFGKVEEIAYDSLEEEIKAVDNLIIFKKAKKVLKRDISKKDIQNISLEGIEGLIIDVLEVEDSLVVLSKKDLMRYSLYTVDLNTLEISSINFSTYDIVSGILLHNKDIFYITQSSITNSRTGYSFDLGSIVYACGSFGSAIAIIKDDWSYLKNELGEKVEKPKWKSR